MSKFGPLTLADRSGDEAVESKCLLCEDSFNLNLCLPTFLKHMFEAHQLVIEEAQNVDNFDEYVRYWRDKFKESPIEQLLPAVSVTSTDAQYFVLSTLTPQDRQLRHRLKLERMLAAQEFERTDGEFHKPCLFCKLAFAGRRYGYLSHLADDHNIRLGNPQNLVYIDELIGQIEKTLERLQCLYCEKSFPDRAILKEHMRKKQHKRINPANRAYDKYYAVNYLDPDRKWHSIDREVDPLRRHADVDEENSDEQYECWIEPDSSIICLFCDATQTDINRLCLHMSSRHRFNFYALTQQLNFYQKVKLVNYVRRQMHRRRCINCDEEFSDVDAANKHMESVEHCHLPDEKLYDQPEFYFPTYENDSFLYFLEDIED